MSRVLRKDGDFAVLVGSGCGPEELLQRIAAVVSFSSFPDFGPRYRTIPRRLSDRMSSIATEIEALPLYQQALFAQAIKVDFHPAVLNPTAIVPVATTILRAVTDFARLPRLLREGRKLLEDEKRRNKKRGLGRVFRVLFEDSEAAPRCGVRNRTGSYHYGEAEGSSRPSCRRSETGNWRSPFILPGL